MTSKSKSFTTETKLVRELSIIFDEKDLTELELETDDISIRLARSQKDQQILTMPQQAVGSHAQPSAPAVVSTPDAISETSTNITSSDLSSNETLISEYFQINNENFNSIGLVMSCECLIADQPLLRFGCFVFLERLKRLEFERGLILNW